MPRRPVRARSALVAVLAALAVLVGGALPAAAVPASITGTVSGPDGPVAGASVHAYTWGDDFGWWGWAGSATTSDDGTYALELEEGVPYRLGVWDPSETVRGGYLLVGEDGVTTTTRYLEQATDVPAPAVVDVTLAGTAAISGTVSGASGPLTGVTVVAYAFDPTFGFWQEERRVWTDEAGGYRIAGLQDGAEHRLRFEDESGAHTGGFLRDDAGVVSLVREAEDGTGVWAPSTAPDVVLPDVTPITGTISGPDGPVAGIGVTAYREIDGGTREVARATTAEDGSYLLTDVAAGESVRLELFVPGNVLLDGWYRSVDGVASVVRLMSDATDVVAPAEGVDVTLAAAARLTGTATGPGGAPAAGLPVQVLGQSEWGGWSEVESGTTDDAGAYSIGVPPGGPYLVLVQGTFAQPLLRDGYYRAGGIATESEPAATPVTAPAAGLDLQLAGTVAISGTVHGPDGPATGVSVQALLWHEDQQRWQGDGFGEVAEDGTFVVSGLAEGAEYRLRFSADRWSGQGLLGGFLRETAVGSELVRKVADATSIVAPHEGIEVTLGLAPKITGTLVGPDGPGLGHFVTAWTPDEDGNWMPWVGADLDESGTFTLPSLEPTTPYVLELSGSGETIGWYRTDAAGHVTYVQDIREATHVEAPASGLVLPVGAAPVATVAPAVGGSTHVGATLTAAPGSWSVTGLTYEYQWFRSGVPVAGATSASYALTSADLGARLSVRVVASKQGHATGEATSAESAAVTAPPATGTAPKALVKPFVLGLPKVGSPLVAFPGLWSAPDVRFTFQWLRAGEPIRGATSLVYVPTTADKGSKLSVVVTATRTGAPAGTATSASTSPVTTWFGR